MPAHEFLLPDLGEGLIDATVVKWLVAVGDLIAVDQPVAEVETAKATVEVPSPHGGIVTVLCAAEGETLAIGKPLLVVAGEDEDVPVARDSGSGPVLVGYGTVQRRTRNRRDLFGAPASGGPASGGPVAAPVRGAVAVASPVVRRLAKDHGVDLAKLRGSGPDGLIVRADVVAATRPATPAAADGARRVPIRGRRKAAADQFTRSHTEIPAATCWVEADATELRAAKRRISTDARPIGLLALLGRICVAALARHPDLNSTVDTERGELVLHRAVHLGFAAQGRDGLVVPVVRDAQALGTAALAAEMARLVARARSGELTPAEMSGGTFTLNNYGVFGVDGAAPLLNHPEAAMLGVGRIVARPWGRDGGIELRDLVQLGLTFDHRVCDGAVAGGFLRHVADCVEEPLRLLVDN
ncbi:dihydrolipoamide acetyltransferase family protein [Amycolatopsis sp. NPDC051128]|uniref:dihydrolipoamide acetyltransferase family protein n=1 Tax=Amycolatopsis sp. NPDC051128 TaxID=3155412 RepID=UPI003426A78C